MVYLANRLQVGDRSAPASTVSGTAFGAAMRLGELPYAVVAAVEPGLTKPLGPIIPAGADEGNDIFLVDLPTGRPMAAPNTSVTIHYFKPEMEGRVQEASFTCQLAGRISLAGAAKNPDLTPNLPGVTDKASVGDWDPPFPYDPSIVTPMEEKFWEANKATPKAYISLSLGKKLFGSRFGDATSVRVAAPNPGDAQTLEAFRAAVLDQLRAEPGRFRVEEIGKAQKAASGGATDFGLLLVGFSFFLILSGVMLLRLLYRLHVERRVREWGLLSAVGFSKWAIRRLVVAEGMAVALVGTLFGLILASLYAIGMARLFAALWPADWLGGALEVSAPWHAFALGAALTLAAAYWSIRSAISATAKVSTVDRLRNQTPETVDGRRAKPNKFFRVSAWAAVLAGLCMVPGSLQLPPGEARAGGFFGGGFLLLLGMLGIFWIRLRNARGAVDGLKGLSARNVALRPSRSLLTAGVLAAAVFLLVAVESFRRSPADDFDKLSGGSGGYRLAVDLDLPLFQDPAVEGRADIDAELQRLDQREGGTKWRDEARELLPKLKTAACAVRPGDDASCLNLYQATKPRVVGVPDELIQRGGFAFGGVLDGPESAKENPWLWLTQPQTDGTIPTFVEQNTAQWQLKKGLGDILEMPGDSGETLKFKIVGLLKDSFFQSDLVIGMEAFRKAFPKREGFSLVLVDCPPETEEAARALLPRAFARQGAAVTRTRDAVALALEAQNTYLTIFQLLGGFGVLLGMGGLAVVLLRNLEERRKEFALLRSLGYRTADVAKVTVARVRATDPDGASHRANIRGDLGRAARLRRGAPAGRAAGGHPRADIRGRPAGGMVGDGAAVEGERAGRAEKRISPEATPPPSPLPEADRGTRGLFSCSPLSASGRGLGGGVARGFRFTSSSTNSETRSSRASVAASSWCEDPPAFRCVPAVARRSHPRGR